MNVLDTTEDLIHEELNMLVSETLTRLYYLAKIRLHQLCNNV